MRYLKALIILILILWPATAPIAKNSKPGSSLYRWHVVVNEPVWEWVHITQQGRSETVERQLEARYEEYARAIVSKDANQLTWVEKAEDATARRVVSRIQSAASSKDYKSADSLSTHAEAITRAHKQVLRAVAVKAGTDEIAVGERMNARLQALADIRLSVTTQFLDAYKLQGLVKGLDEKFNALTQSLAQTDTALTLYNSSFSETQRLALQNTYAFAEKTAAEAKTRWDQDRYVEAFQLASVAEGYALEVRIVIDGIRLYEVPAIPTITQ